MAQTTTTVRIPFTVTIGDGGPEGASFAHDVRLDGTHCHVKPARAKKLLQSNIAAQVDAALECRHNADPICVLVCGDGTVLTVRYGRSGWGYEIHKATLRRPSYNSGEDSYDAAIMRAREHAMQCYGGVVWESRQ